MPTRPSSRTDEPIFDAKRYWWGIGLICVLAIACSISLNISLRQRFHQEATLPVFSKMKGDLEATERSGKTVHTSALKGKVRVFAYVYTVCPHGCIAVVGEMLKLKKEFADHADFHLVSVSVVPERDNAKFLSGFANGTGLKPEDPWWFLTGDRAKLSSFMTDQLKLEPSKLIPEHERLNPLDLYEHDLRIVLVDRQDNVRGYYSVFHPQPEIAQIMREKLHRDTQRLLNEPIP